MADLRVRTIDETEIPTVLGDDIEFEGTVEFTEPLLVKGTLSGEVRSASELFIAPQAYLKANVAASRISVKGQVTGDLVASERIELFAGATIQGNITTPDLIVQSGGVLQGSCTMVQLTTEESGAPAGEAPKDEQP
jgi:cytoskeletal protein CcmA (bactofilin family)